MLFRVYSFHNSIYDKVFGSSAEAGVNNESVDVNLTSGPDNPIDVVPNTGLQNGQHWTFTISGNINNQQGAAFTASANLNL